MFGGWDFATDLAWELKSPQTLPRVREVRMKGRRTERGQVTNGVGQGEWKGREKRKEGQERGFGIPRFLYESCAARAAVGGFRQKLNKIYWYSSPF